MPVLMNNYINKWPTNWVRSTYPLDFDFQVSGGYRDVGYNRIHVDDCWLASSRDANGKLQANSSRFPSGIKGLAKYVFFYFLIKT